MQDGSASKRCHLVGASVLRDRHPLRLAAKQFGASFLVETLLLHQRQPCPEFLTCHHHAS
jgi:hypothetical protein